MKKYPNLNKIKRRKTDMGDRTEERSLKDLSREVDIDESSRIAAHFQDLEGALIRYIKEADAVVGCIAWLTNLNVLRVLASKSGVSIIVQKEEFLRPDLEPLKPGWKKTLRKNYESIRPIESPVHAECGWLEERIDEDFPGDGRPLYAVGLRCVGHLNLGSSTMPRMHHKFLVFLRKRHPSDPEVEAGAWLYYPYAVWTGSYNITRNGNASLENALYVQNCELAEVYCAEWAQLLEISEPLNWESIYAAPVIDYNTGAYHS